MKQRYMFFKSLPGRRIIVRMYDEDLKAISYEIVYRLHHDTGDATQEGIDTCNQLIELIQATAEDVEITLVNKDMIVMHEAYDRDSSNWEGICPTDLAPYIYKG